MPPLGEGAEASTGNVPDPGVEEEDGVGAELVWDIHLIVHVQVYKNEGA